jgi:UDPglucose 6-dehydrogenase
MGLDSRIGSGFLRAGPGFGGACLPKDTQALLHTSRVFGTGSRILSAALEVNSERVHHMVRKIQRAVGGVLEGRRIGVLGVTFKGETDDTRESPAVAIVRALVAAGTSIRLFDPAGIARAKDELPPGVDYAIDPYDAMAGADCLVIATDWKQFALLDLAVVRQSLANPVMVDLRNLYDPADVAAAGISYFSVGRPDR